MLVLFPVFNRNKSSCCVHSPTHTVLYTHVGECTLSIYLCITGPSWLCAIVDPFTAARCLPWYSQRSLTQGSLLRLASGLHSDPQPTSSVYILSTHLCSKNNPADFHTYLRWGRPLAHWESEPDVVHIHSTPEKYSITFSYADLNPTNIMVKDGYITAIIDWEFAGWYPEYRDYCKMHQCLRTPLWNNFYRAIEGEDGIAKYPEKLACEQAIWNRMHPWSYDDPRWRPEDDEQAPEAHDVSVDKEVLAA
jgi:hypothetical protein